MDDGDVQQIRRLDARIPVIFVTLAKTADAAIEAMTDLRIGISPSEKIFWRQHKIDRDVAVAFLLDMSGSTGEAIKTVISSVPGALDSGASSVERAQRRIIDVEKEAIVLMMDALESIGDRYGVYGFSGHGLQQAPGVGRALSELIVHEKFRTLDLSAFSYDRIPAGRPHFEREVI